MQTFTSCPTQIIRNELFPSELCQADMNVNPGRSCVGSADEIMEPQQVGELSKLDSVRFLIRLESERISQTLRFSIRRRQGEI